MSRGQYPRFATGFVFFDELQNPLAVVEVGRHTDITHDVEERADVLAGRFAPNQQQGVIVFAESIRARHRCGRNPTGVGADAL